MNDESQKTFSISMRLQRTITEFAFVSVPVTQELLVDQSDGTQRLDVNKVTQYALELGQTHGLNWQPEDAQIQLHPIQTAPPEL
jgi:hypothetical protein